MKWRFSISDIAHRLNMTSVIFLYIAYLPFSTLHSQPDKRINHDIPAHRYVCLTFKGAADG